MCAGESEELGVWEVEVVDGDYGCGEGVRWGAEGLGEGADLRYYREFKSGYHRQMLSV